MASPPLPDFPKLIAGLTRELQAREIPFMLIGGQAVLLHGRPRLTEDIDVTLGVDPSRLPLIEATCAALQLTPLPEDIAAFVHDTFVLPAHDSVTGIRVDFIFSTTSYEQQAIDRAVRVELGGESVPFASVEDLLIHKLFAGRAHDIEDARTVVRRKDREIDWAYVKTWARKFAEVPGREEMPDRVARLQQEGNDPRRSSRD